MPTHIKTTSIQNALAADIQDQAVDLFEQTRGGRQVAHEWFMLPERLNSRSLPYAVCAADGDLDSLFADIATYFPAWSPLSAHLYALDESTRQLALGEPTERSRPSFSERNSSAWVGLAFGEALTTAVGGAADGVSYSSCRRTLTYSLARSSALFPQIPLRQTGARWIAARELAHMEVQIPVVSTLIWISEQLRSDGNYHASDPLSQQVIRFIRAEVSEATLLQELRKTFPVIGPYITDLEGPFDNRMSAFYKIATEVLRYDQVTQELGAIVLGFFCNKLLPGSLIHSKSLVEYVALYPSVCVWYALFASLSESFDWRSVQDGVGGKLIRDITRSFSLSDPPECDISVDELAVLARVAVRSSNVKPSQPRALIVGLLPGVDVWVRMPASADEELRTTANAQNAARVVSLLQEAIALLHPSGEPRASAEQKRTRRIREK